jgi:hypothetical protein
MSRPSVGRKSKEQQTVTDLLHRNFPDLKHLDELRRVQAHDRKYLEFLEQKGVTDRVVELLHSMVESREIEINTLLAKGQFPSSELEFYIALSCSSPQTR